MRNDKEREKMKQNTKSFLRRIALEFPRSSVSSRDKADAATPSPTSQPPQRRIPSRRGGRFLPIIYTLACNLRLKYKIDERWRITRSRYTLTNTHKQALIDT